MKHNIVITIEMETEKLADVYALAGNLATDMERYPCEVVNIEIDKPKPNLHQIQYARNAEFNAE